MRRRIYEVTVYQEYVWRWEVGMDEDVWIQDSDDLIMFIIYSTRRKEIGIYTHERSLGDPEREDNHKDMNCKSRGMSISDQQYLKGKAQYYPTLLIR